LAEAEIVGPDRYRKCQFAEVEGAQLLAPHLAAMSGARFNPVLKPIYDWMIEAGKPPKVAFIALARKLLTMLNAMVRDGTEWNEGTA
jgi:hypothetical protein